MTGPTSTKQTSTNRAPREGTDTANGAPTVSDRELEELARTQEDVAQRARRIVAGDVVASATDDGDDDERGHRLLDEARAGLLAELRSQEQDQARRQLVAASRSSEDAVAGLVQGITTIVRSIVPAAVVRPEDVIEASFALADQGLRVGRRLALSVTSGVRSLSAAA